jgi:hypothetical protein
MSKKNKVKSANRGRTLTSLSQLSSAIKGIAKASKNTDFVEDKVSDDTIADLSETSNLNPEQDTTNEVDDTYVFTEQTDSEETTTPEPQSTNPADMHLTDDISIEDKLKAQQMDIPPDSDSVVNAVLSDVASKTPEPQLDEDFDYSISVADFMKSCPVSEITVTKPKDFPDINIYVASLNNAEEYYALLQMLQSAKGHTFTRDQLIRLMAMDTRALIRLMSFNGNSEMKSEIHTFAITIQKALSSSTVPAEIIYAYRKEIISCVMPELDESDKVWLHKVMSVTLPAFSLLINLVS